MPVRGVEDGEPGVLSTPSCELKWTQSPLGRNLRIERLYKQHKHHKKILEFCFPCSNGKFRVHKILSINKPSLLDNSLSFL